MKTAAQFQPPKASPDLAPCLRVLPPPFNSLFGLVETAVLEMKDPTLDRPFRIRPDEAYPARGLLVLLAYCYCNGVYFSRDVEDSTRDDPRLKNLFEREPPDWNTLRRFRRAYRQALRDCLHRILERALEVRFGDMESAPFDACVAAALDRWLEPLCFPHPEREAQERVERAALVDGMLLD